MVKYERKDVKSDQSIEFIVPNKPLNILKNILQDQQSKTNVLYNKTNAIFNFSNFKLVCRLIDGKYPNYDAVIPKENQMFLKLTGISFYRQQKGPQFF